VTGLPDCLLLATLVVAIAVAVVGCTRARPLLAYVCVRMYVSVNVQLILAMGHAKKGSGITKVLIKVTSLIYKFQSR